MAVSKNHDFIPWKDWRGSKETQPCAHCGFTRSNKHHKKEVEIGRQSANLRKL